MFKGFAAVVNFKEGVKELSSEQFVVWPFAIDDHVKFINGLLLLSSFFALVSQIKFIRVIISEDYCWYYFI